MLRIFLILLFNSVQIYAFSQIRYKYAMTYSGILGHTYVRASGTNEENWRMKFAPTYGLQVAIHKFLGEHTELKSGVGITAYKNVFKSKSDEYKANYIVPYLFSSIKTSISKNNKNISAGIFGGIQPAYRGSYQENFVRFQTTIIGKKHLQLFLGPIFAFKVKDYMGKLYEFSVFYQIGTLSVGELILEKNNNKSHYNSNGSYIGVAFSMYHFPWKGKIIKRTLRRHRNRPICP